MAIAAFATRGTRHARRGRAAWKARGDYNPAVAVRVDLEARTVRCSVHDLLPLRRAVGPRRGRARGWPRLSVGAQLHRVIQGQRQDADPRYAAEVAPRRHGRGRRLEPPRRRQGRRGRPATPTTGPVVEEIKTLHFGRELHDLFAHQRLERFRWQARIYAFFLFPAGDAVTRLLLVDLGGEDQREEAVAWSPGQVQAYLRSRLHALVAMERERQRVLEAWRAAAEVLPFPFPAPRPVQAEAMEAIREALGNGAPPAARGADRRRQDRGRPVPGGQAGARQSGKRVAMLTAKTLQQKLAVETLQRMNRGRLALDPAPRQGADVRQRAR